MKMSMKRIQMRVKLNGMDCYTSISLLRDWNILKIIKMFAALLLGPIKKRKRNVSLSRATRHAGKHLQTIPQDAAASNRVTKRKIRRERERETSTGQRSLCINVPFRFSPLPIDYSCEIDHVGQLFLSTTPSS